MNVEHSIQPPSVVMLRMDTRTQCVEILTPAGLVLYTLNPLQTLTVLHLFLEAVLGRAAGVPVPPYVEVRQQITQPIMNPTRDE